MKGHTRGARWAILLLTAALATGLSGCGDRLPREVEAAIINAFDPDEQPRLQSVNQVDPLPVDLEAGAEEVWCVNIIFRCFTPVYYGRDELSTCGDNRLVRLVDGQYQIIRLRSDEDEADWIARGCELLPPIIALP